MKRPIQFLTNTLLKYSFPVWVSGELTTYTTLMWSHIHLKTDREKEVWLKWLHKRWETVMKTEIAEKETSVSVLEDVGKAAEILESLPRKWQLLPYKHIWPFNVKSIESWAIKLILIWVVVCLSDFLLSCVMLTELCVRFLTKLAGCCDSTFCFTLL